MGLAGRLQRHAQGDLSRAIAKAVLRLMMVSDAGGLIGAKPRVAQRKGGRDRALGTRLGTLDLKVPKRRQSRYFPGVLETRKTPVRTSGWAASRPEASTGWCKPCDCAVSRKARCSRGASRSMKGLLFARAGKSTGWRQY